MTVSGEEMDWLINELRLKKHQHIIIFAAHARAEVSKRGWKPRIGYKKMQEGGRKPRHLFLREAPSGLEEVFGSFYDPCNPKSDALSVLAACIKALKRGTPDED